MPKSGKKKKTRSDLAVERRAFRELFTWEVAGNDSELLFRKTQRGTKRVTVEEASCEDADELSGCPASRSLFRDRQECQRIGDF
ncbi:hypothetical protein CEXT_663801 [Caerostris extrusa]|uniref:Uncharacterized protein n=1 Tax=Caerostris extrusa TaxID=172846 RepID=A0AAV4M6A7_CAEEX|nr:hypothetical protein CEXT_663801 [Caerostris extrusa]